MRLETISSVSDHIILITNSTVRMNFFLDWTTHSWGREVRLLALRAI